jgi:hypothetical protein
MGVLLAIYILYLVLIGGVGLQSEPYELNEVISS